MHQVTTTGGFSWWTICADWNTPVHSA